MSDRTVADIVERRRRAAVAGQAGDLVTARSLVADPAGPVRAAALAALARLGELTAGDVAGALADADASVRRRAARLAAAVPDADVVGALGDDEPYVAEMAAWALGEQGRRDAAAIDALAGMAVEHADPLCREAAVAALGAIGDPGGLAAVLAATTDKPAVRRRAVIALAAFEGRDVDAALARATTDRDWQVRQAAEDLLR